MLILVIQVLQAQTNILTTILLQDQANTQRYQGKVSLPPVMRTQILLVF